MAGVFSVGIAVCLGVPLGLLAGYFGGWLDMIISRVTEAFLAMPFLITAIALAAFLGPSLTNAMIAIGFSAMPIFIRLTRGQTLAVKTEDYVEGARSIGLRNSSIVLRYILPNVFSPILVQATLTVAAAIIAEASLSFLGLGQQPPAPSWGSMLTSQRTSCPKRPDGHMARHGIFVVVMGFNSTACAIHSIPARPERYFMAPFTTRPEIQGNFGVVTTTHWIASSVGMSILERGGNAFDAAVAAGFVLQVVEPHLVGPGGDLPAIVYSAEKAEVEVVCARARRPPPRRSSGSLRRSDHHSRRRPARDRHPRRFRRLDAPSARLRNDAPARCTGAGDPLLPCRASGPAAGFRHHQGHGGLLPRRVALLS